ncbi:MAG TPA: lipoprotein insertase outer membrane protein LolB [Tahibacter sp.]|uniref:lipoprotein insertase outer membrane protein LolB n=1 Tax=Tahibacter sp. TaxID=2056211 RepID=UPI002C17FE86|nr:lipoprotein insertase outer membrane protein LolB [Tahibacter sp.]HSX62533.1 lipoprotein insertase outer membrane protein LolB [Tahibacter sp.]
MRKSRTIAAARLLPVVCVLGLAACAPLRLREDDATLTAQGAREAAVLAQSRWQLTGRIAVSNGDDGGNADVDWSQDGARYDLRLRAPVTGKNWRLHGDARSATLEGVRDQVMTGTSAAELLAREANWQLPVAELEYWVRGLRAPGSKAELVFDDAQRPAKLLQAGWTIEYREYFDDGEPAMPRKVFATKGKHRVRLFVEDWQVQ